LGKVVSAFAGEGGGLSSALFANKRTTIYDDVAKPLVYKCNEAAVAYVESYVQQLAELQRRRAR
jgi:hypothetical protein